MSSKNLSKLRGGLSRGIEIERTIDSLTDKRASKIRSKRKKKSGVEIRLKWELSKITVNNLKQILRQNNLPTSGVKKELIARIVENDISVIHDLNNRKITDLESKLPVMEDRVKALKTEIKTQNHNLKSVKIRKTEADERVRKAKNSLRNRGSPILKFGWGLFCGLILLFSGMFILVGLDLAGVFAVQNDEGEFTDIGNSLSSGLMFFSCCILPFFGGFLASPFPSVFDPVSVEVKLRNSVDDEIRKEEAPINTSKIELASLEGQISDIEGQISRVKQNSRDMEKTRKQIEKLEDEIEDLDKKISNLRVELKENYAEISHMVPYSYMLE